MDYIFEAVDYMRKQEALHFGLTFSIHITADLIQLIAFYGEDEAELDITPLELKSANYNILIARLREAQNKLI